jgi:levansucrase
VVLGNPEEARTPQYFHNVLPDGLVENFIDSVPTADGGTRFGGTPARTLVVSLKGSKTMPIKQTPRSRAWTWVPAPPGGH